MPDPMQLIDALLERVGEKADVKESVEWYLRNNLNDYKRALQSNASFQEIENATRALTRFGTESMDWNTSLYRDCCAITDEGQSWRSVLRHRASNHRHRRVTGSKNIYPTILPIAFLSILLIAPREPAECRDDEGLWRACGVYFSAWILCIASAALTMRMP